MNQDYTGAVVERIRSDLSIRCAAITGSTACESGTDEHSDLDLLLVTDRVDEIRDVRRWLPEPERIAIAAMHLRHYCSVLMDDLRKIDLAIYSTEESPNDWVVQHFRVIKGGSDFRRQLESAREATNRNRVAHLNPDVSIDNVLLLLSTAAKRSMRGENLSARSLVAMAAEMVACLALQRGPVPSNADRLDPWRRLDRFRQAPFSRARNAV